MTADHATGPYQTFDPLSPEEFAALEADILERGVMVPIEFDEDGNVLDGHHRLRICRRNNITDYPSVIRRGFTEQQKRSHARKLNMARRHLTREQKQAQIEQALREETGSSDRKIARELKVDHKTVAAARKRMVDAGKIPHTETRTGLNGMAFTPPQKPKLVDAVGGEVPQWLAKLFASRPEYQRLLNELRDIKRRSLELAKLNLVLRAQEPVLRQHLDRLSDLLGSNEPHAVHRPCGGDGCTECKGLGFTAGGETPQGRDE